MTVYRGNTIQVNLGSPNEIQSLIDLLNSSVASAESSATAAATSAGNIEDFAVEAENWANTAEDTLVPEGDGVDDYSALHHAAKAAASATAAATSETNAETAATSAQALLDSFEGVYYGTDTSDPALDPNGNAVGEGDLYFNTSTSTLMIYNGSSWVATAGASGASTVFEQFDEDTGTTTGLTWGFKTGNLRVNNTISSVSAGTVSLTGASTNYVELDPSDQTVKVNTTAFTAGRIPLRTLTTDASTITVNTDSRGWLTGDQVFYGGLTQELPCSDQVVSRPEIKDYSETCSTPSSSAGALDIDLESGNVAEVTLTENTTVTFSNPPATGIAGSLTLILHQDATGSRTVTWPASVKWAEGTAPTLSTSASAIDVLTFVTTDAGTNWYGFLSGGGMA